MFQAQFAEKITTHTFPVQYFFSDNPTVCQILWKNIVEPNRPQMTIWCMRIALWIPKATNTHSEYVILIGLLRQQWFRESASVSGYTYIACLVTAFSLYNCRINSDLKVMLTTGGTAWNILSLNQYNSCTWKFSIL